MNLLRPSLLPGLLDALQHNLNHKTNDVPLFELGRVFSQSNNRTREYWRLAVALTGTRNPLFWTGDDREAKYDIHDLKGLLEQFLEQFGLHPVSWLRHPATSTFWAESGLVQSGPDVLGEFGQLLPTLARQFDLRDPVFLAELNLDLLLARRSTAKAFTPLPIFPSIRRDVAMLVPEATTHQAILNTVEQAQPEHLESVQLFDVFRGKNIPAGQKSMAYAFTYRHAERTLTDAEANAAHQKVIDQFKTSLQAIIRDAG